MPATFRYTAGAILSLIAASSQLSTAPAQDTFVAPTYSRSRMGADDWQARGGYGHGGGHVRPGYGYGFYQPYISPVIAGSWYARPYPYHFDYYRNRWGGGPNGYQGGTTSDCPCAADAPAPVPSP
jgi:hypothetical protein